MYRPDYKRITLQLEPDEVYPFLKIMSGVEGLPMTKYVHRLIEKDMEEHRELYEAVKKLKES